jgi:hypothetical protein
MAEHAKKEAQGTGNEIQKQEAQEMEKTVGWKEAKGKGRHVKRRGTKDGARY